MIALLIASITLVGCSLADGITTVQKVANGPFIETDPLLVKLFGTNKPKAWQTLGIGMAIIAGEIAAAWVCNHYSALAGNVFAVGGFVQAGIHAYEARSNYLLK